MFPKSVCVYLIFLSFRTLFEREVLSADKSDDYNPCAIIETDDPTTSITRMSLSADKLKNLANDRYHDGKYEEADRCYSKAIKIYPDEAKYYRNRGLNYERMEKVDLALADYRISLEYEPFNVRACYSLGLLLHKRGEFQEAANFFQKALDYGDEPHMANDESHQIRSLLDEARDKIEEIEKAKQRLRLDELLNFLKNLISKDIEKKLTRTEDHDQRQKLQSHRTDYITELEIAFNDLVPPIPLRNNGIPEYLCDKITLDMMRNPMITPSGISFEKVQIMRHLATDDLDPVSRLPLRPDQLRPNKLLKTAIDSFMRRHGLTYRTVSQYFCGDV